MRNVKARILALLMVMWVALLALPTTVMAAVNTTAISDMSDTLIALIIALVPIALILAFWAKMRGIW